MKHLAVYSCLLFALAGCSKDNTVNPPPSPPPGQTSYQIHIKEFSTGKHIVGATLKIEKCDVPDIEFGCTHFAPYQTLISDGTGAITVPISRDYAERHYTISANGYWTFGGKSVGDTDLIPKATVMVTVSKVNSYSPGDQLIVGVYKSWIPYSISYLHRIPQDTVIYLDGLGYMDNTLAWGIDFQSPDSVTSSHNLGSYYISGKDTAKVNLLY